MSGLNRIFSCGRRFILAAGFIAALQGCASGPLNDADAIANSASMQQQEITSGSFRLTIFSRIRDANQPITIYVDGDLRGWAPSADPGIDSTPDEYLELRLAALDPATNVVFIAHPCQFGIADPVCYNDTWQNGRLAEQVVSSINHAIDYVTITFIHPQVNLVGYSGGGAIAAVLAARRQDVISLRTIAGNLDPNGNGRAHAADPQDEFVDPMLIAPRLAMLPQIHFVGDKDVFVPPFLTENFIKAIGPSYCVKVIQIPEATHRKGWEDAWAEYATKLPACRALIDRSISPE
ncbi:MAG: alpha/beta hydrolase [Alphaproteobacteria bacterium]|nr:alpha/beta hydrolase [Alphaproteobacteria bacterium]